MITASGTSRDASDDIVTCLVDQDLVEALIALAKVTRILEAATHPDLLPICRAVAFIRADIWRRYGALGTVSRTPNDVKKGCRHIYKQRHLDGSIRNASTSYIVDELYANRAAAETRVKQAIRRRTGDDAERKRLYTLLKSGDWTSDNFLHRQMRKRFRHGVIRCANQFIVRSDKFSTGVVDGCLCITIKIAKRYGSDITLTTTSSGKNVDLTGKNLRVIVKGDRAEIHYSMDRPKGREAGDRTIGVDKGYTEAFADSDGGFHGEDFGKILTAFSDATFRTNRQRNKLHALEKKHRKAGRIKKAERIRRNNLGRKKITARRDKARRRLRNIAYKAAHAVVDKASTVAAEDLSHPIAARKDVWKGLSRRMSFWAKGVLAQALHEVTEQRGASLELVASAYTSQIDSQTGRLEGRRDGDRFYHASGDVSHADTNAAQNVLSRLDDPEITRFMPHREIRQILMARSPAELTVMRPELQLDLFGYQPGADKPSAHAD